MGTDGAAVATELIEFPLRRSEDIVRKRQAVREKAMLAIDEGGMDDALAVLR